MTDPTTPTLFNLKKSFIDSQIRVLSSNLTPPHNWQDDVPLGPGGDLPQRAIDQALMKVNLIARKHNRSVYSTQTVRGVAEQIEASYGLGRAGNGGGDNEMMEGSGDGDEDGSGGGASGGGRAVLRRGTDMTDVDIISLLPENYPTSTNNPHSLQPTAADAARYQTLRGHLMHSATALKAQRLRNEYYAQLHSRLELFSQPQRDVQPNLVSRGGELDREMEKMRSLALRLSVQIERAKGLIREQEEGEGEGMEGVEVEEEEDEEDERVVWAKGGLVGAVDQVSRR